MRLHLAAIGRLKKGAEKTLADDYFDRVRKFGRNAGISGISVHEFAESNAATSTLRKKDEAERLISSCPSGAIVIVLDENGKDYSSAEFSKLMEKLKDNGAQNLALLIGGPDGHEDTLLSNVNYKLALGRMTWPHRLARIMIAEQIYRAVTIMLNHPYHRE